MDFFWRVRGLRKKETQLYLLFPNDDSVASPAFWRWFYAGKLQLRKCVTGLLAELSH